MSSINLACGYYLKALDNFHYAADEALEQLNYALSYDDAHAPSYCLMGALHMHYLKDYTEATHCFELVLLYDSEYVDTYKWYIILCLWLGDLDKADQLIQRASQLPAFPKSSVYQYNMMITEIKGDIPRAIRMTDLGLRGALCDTRVDFFNSHAKRLKAKLPKKSDKKGKSRKKKKDK